MTEEELEHTHTHTLHNGDCFLSDVETFILKGLTLQLTRGLLPAVRPTVCFRGRGGCRVRPTHVSARCLLERTASVSADGRRPPLTQRGRHHEDARRRRLQLGVLLRAERHLHRLTAAVEVHDGRFQLHADDRHPF